MSEWLKNELAGWLVALMVLGGVIGFVLASVWAALMFGNLLTWLGL